MKQESKKDQSKEAAALADQNGAEPYVSGTEVCICVCVGVCVCVYGCV